MEDETLFYVNSCSHRTKFHSLKTLPLMVLSLPVPTSCTNYHVSVNGIKTICRLSRRLNNSFQMVQGANQVVSTQARSNWALIAQRVSYVRHLRKNFEELERRSNDLSTKRDQENNLSVGYQFWVKKVNMALVEVVNIKKNYDNEQEGIKRICPDYFSRMRLGERVVDLTNKIKKILDEPSVSSLLESPAVKALEVTESFLETVQKLISQITEKTHPRIGIYGPHGVGKTSIMQLLKQRVEVTRDFDFVIWVTVSNFGTIRTLQDQVRQCLSMKITTYESDEKVAERIFRVLLGKKYMLFLDDVTKPVDLNDLGLPNASTENGCQVVMTTKTRNMCWHMRTGFDIEAKSFTTMESLKMFHSLVSVETTEALNYYSHMFDGVPRSLKIVAGTLRNLLMREEFVNDFYLQNLDLISLSFEKLEVTRKACLEYCSCHPEHHKINKSRVINYMRASTGEFILEESCPKTHEEMEKIFDDLVKSSWLESCEGGKHVTMPVVLRDLLLSKQSKKVLTDLPTNLVKPSTIVSLLLQGNSRLETLPGPSLINMLKLQNLDLSGTRIKSLPDNISDLKSLRALFLKDCYFLETLPEKLGEVETLEFLQVSGAWMPQLPIWIFKIKSLKFLKFGYRSIARWWLAPHHLGIGKKECEIEPGSVLKFTQIEVFDVSNFMYNSRLNDESLSTIAKELGSLTQLSSLQFVFRTIEDLEQFIHKSIPWQQNALQKFRFIVGEGKDFRADVKTHKQCLKYIGGSRSGGLILPNAVLEVLSKSSFFELENHGDITCLSDLGAEATRGVRHCIVHGCANMSHVLNNHEIATGIFENLESLTLSNLPYLWVIAFDHHAQNCRSFANLKELEIQFCPMSWAAFRGPIILNDLEELRIKSCSKLHVLSYDEIVSLPRLKKVILADLPKLECIFEWTTMSLDSLEEVCICNCPMLTKLSFDARKLKKLEGSRKWWDQVQDEYRLRYESLFVEA